MRVFDVNFDKIFTKMPQCIFNVEFCYIQRETGDVVNAFCTSGSMD